MTYFLSIEIGLAGIIAKAEKPLFNDAGTGADEWQKGRLADTISHPAPRKCEEPEQISNFCALCQSQGVLHINPEVPDRALDLRMAKQNLDCAEVSGRLVDNRRLRPPQRMRAIILARQADPRYPPASGESRKKGENSTWNEAEVEATMRLLNLIAAQEEFAAALAKDEEQAIGVICMYKKQKRELERRFAQQPFDPAFRRTVKIDTVDSYQGKENAIVILSLVRANGHFEAGHVRSSNRCNVAVSRARERLFIIGNSMMWRDKRCRSPMRSVIDQIDRDRTGNAAVVRMDAIR